MRIISLLYTVLVKLKRYGLSGVVAYPRILLERRAKKGYFKRNALRFPVERPEMGITVIGALSKNASLSKTLRDFVCALVKAGIPVQTYDTAEPSEKQVFDSDMQGIVTLPEEFKIRKYTHVVSMINRVLPAGDLGLKSARIGFWEFESGYEYAYPEMCGGGNRIAMSDFNAECFRSVTKDGSIVHKILYPFKGVPDGLMSNSKTRERFNIPQDAFVVFFNFDLYGTYHRKNPIGAMHAFALAFPNAGNAYLVFKVMRAKQFPAVMEELKSMAQTLGIVNRFVIITDYLPERELYSLTNCCDVYLSLHRGEGFGITVAEAMSLGKPVVVTNYSSTTEFCNEGNSIPVPYKLVSPLPSQIGIDEYKCVKLWAEPDVEYAAQGLKRLYADAGYRDKIGSEAKKFIAEYFSSDRFRQSVLSFLAC